MKKIITTWLVLFVATSVFAGEIPTLKKLKVFSDRIEITSNQTMAYQLNQPSEENYIYLDFVGAKDSLLSKYSIPKGEVFKTIRIGRHTNPQKVRVVLQSQETTPKIAVEQKGNLLVLRWKKGKEVSAAQQPRPKGITDTSGSSFINNLVERVSGVKQSPKPAQLSEIDAMMPFESTSPKSIVQTETEEKPDLWEEGVKQVTTVYNDTVAFMSETIDKAFAEGGTIDTLKQEIKEFLAPEKTKPAGTVAMNNTPQPKLPLACSKGCNKTKPHVAANPVVSHASIVDLPSKSTMPLKVAVPTPKQTKKASKKYKKEIAQLQKKIDQTYKKSLANTEKVVAKKTALLQKTLERKYQSEAKKVAKEEMDLWLKKKNAAVMELKEQEAKLKRMIASFQTEKEKLDRQMRELNSRNATITCREEPREEFRVVFLPSGSLRVGLEALAQSVHMKINWQAPHEDYYIDKPIRLNALTFEDNLVTIHKALAQNNVYFMFEPNYNKSLLRIRATEAPTQKVARR